MVHHLTGTVATPEQVRACDVEGKGIRLQRAARDQSPAIGARPHLAPCGSKAPSAVEIKSQAGVADKANHQLELRTRELERTKDARRAECDAEEKQAREEEGAASNELLSKHREILEALEDEIRHEQQTAEKKRKAYDGRR